MCPSSPARGYHSGLLTRSNIAVHVVRDTFNAGEGDLGTDDLTLGTLRLLHGHVAQVDNFSEGSTSIVTVTSSEVREPSSVMNVNSVSPTKSSSGVHALRHNGLFRF